MSAMNYGKLRTSLISAAALIIIAAIALKSFVILTFAMLLTLTSIYIYEKQVVAFRNGACAFVLQKSYAELNSPDQSYLYKKECQRGWKYAKEQGYGHDNESLVKAKNI